MKVREPCRRWATRWTSIGLMALMMGLVSTACGKKDRAANTDHEDPKDPTAMLADMAAPMPGAMDKMRQAARPANMRPTGKLLTPADTSELEKVRCGWGRCEVGIISAKAKAEIEKQKNHRKLRIAFRRGSTNAHFATIANLPWVRNVVIDHTKIVDLAPLAGMTDLEKLSARNLGLPTKDKRKIPLDLTPLKNLRKLKALDFHGTKVQNAKVLASTKTLEELGFYMSDLTDIGFVKDLTNLEVLDLYACHTTSIAAVAGLTRLKKLNLYMNRSTDFTPLTELVNLEELWLQFTTIKNLAVLSGMTRMKKLYLNWAKELADLSGLRKMVNLVYFDVSSKKVTDLSVAAKFKKLRTLSAAGTKIKTIAFLKGHADLVIVNLGDTQVTDLAPLAGATKLVSLNISGTKVQSLAPLMEMKKLTFLSFSKDFPKGQLNRLKKRLPKMRVHQR